MLGLVKHLAYVERYWFQQIIAGRQMPTRDPDDEWRLEPGETRDDVVASYQREIAESRRIQAELTDPDATGAFPGED